MDGVSRAVGSPAHVHWCGRLTAVRLTLSILGEIEQYILSSRKSPMEMYREVEPSLHRNAKPIVHDAAMEFALKDNVATLADIQEFLMSRDGVALAMWINTREKDCGGFSFEQCRSESELLGEQELASVARRLLQAGGIDESANLDWVFHKDDSRPVGHSRIPWRKIIRESFDEHGCMPDEFGNLTLYQLQILTRDKKEVIGKLTIPLDELLKKSPAERLEWKAKASLRGRQYKDLYGDAGGGV